jgi:hypothetical protein
MIRFSDCVVLGSVGAITYGAWLIHPPAAFIVGGGLALALALPFAARMPGK